jgi:methylenetetrahydrofolate dehydrogenase (NADP+)/methenyltetrahydrofolate cyclohydrolase
MSELLKGKPVFDAIISTLSTQISNLKKTKKTPKLAIIRIGKKADDLYYERSIQKTCASISMASEVFEYDTHIEQAALENEIKRIVQLPSVHGVLIFTPLPPHLNSWAIRDLIPPQKDVDGLNVDTAGKLYIGDSSAFPPCTPEACVKLLKHYNIPLQGARCTIVGRSLTVGKPLSLLLLNENATVTICHSKTQHLSELCRSADILIAAIGRAKMITRKLTHKDQIVIDIGINKDPDKPGHYCGDVDFELVAPYVKKITPVPGGVGSITTAILCQHTIAAAS